MRYELPHQQRDRDVMPQADDTLPPDTSLLSVEASVRELIAMELAWLAEHAE
jgi:hypothetical protein